MKRKYLLARSIALVAAFAIAVAANAESTVEQLAEQDPDPNNKPTSPDSLAVKSDSDLSTLLQKADYLDRHLQLMAQPESDEEVARSLKTLRERPGVSREVADLYRSLSAMGRANGYLGEARWRVLYLLGDLRNPDTASTLFEIASAPLPNPRESTEIQFKVEYRLRARAIAGLEKLKDAASLKRLYEQRSTASGLAAASLFELDATPEGIMKIDGYKAIGYGDPRDFNPRRSVTDRGTLPSIMSRDQTTKIERVEPSAPNEK
jgi:hypothetical protein